jgi:hypothetical protein
MARRKGFEPLTPRFEVWCSIQLSYRRLGDEGSKAVDPAIHDGPAPYYEGDRKGKI